MPMALVVEEWKEGIHGMVRLDQTRGSISFLWDSKVSMCQAGIFYTVGALATRAVAGQMVRPADRQ